MLLCRLLEPQVDPLTGALSPKTPATTVTDTSAGATTTPVGQVSFRTSATGTFSGTPCTLSGSGASASCQVSFSSMSPTPTATITEGYGGDSTHSASTGTTTVTVVVPASTARCLALSVFGTAKINRTGSVEYRIDVQADTARHGIDTYRIRLDNGYDSGTERIHRGDVDIFTHRARRWRRARG